jgi:hypothetical protein
MEQQELQLTKREAKRQENRQKGCLTSSLLLLGTRVAHEQHGWGTIVGYHPNPEAENDGQLYLYIILLDQGKKHRKKERALVLDRASFKLLK